MPPIKDMMGIDLSGYMPAPAPPPSDFQPEQSLLPRRSPLLRASAIYLPGTFPSSDSLTGYHIGGVIPQFRSPLPPPASAGGAGGVTNINANINASNSTSNVTVTSNNGIIQSASLSIPTTNPGDNYQGSLTLNGESWVMFGFTGTFAMRVRGYATAAAQAGDLTRPITQAPGYATVQDIIFDVNCDTPPVDWDFTPTVIGTNNDEGESQILYVTVTNISASSVTSGSMTITYAPIARFADQL